MQNTIITFKQSFFISKKLVYFLKNGKLWPAWTALKFNIYYWNFAHVSALPMSTKICSEFFWFFFRSSVIDKHGFCECGNQVLFYFCK